ncbi:helix-turn-helix domain-containing protein [Streptomyces litchfieldiae]|uniref:Helix-turn-helix domain-containing protein n=1 Tax=Streptomyces litchfieldiae TaxID=3075543 RepID=A0ABU2MKQ9_9ACTN|nr:helix-turn-helix domain-containing protein [Streptomyces sp. DSM 44938]MDT0341498.1 helix-turn-helix domain-containing protein [Streptomyces sp. DSM 44938]
MKGLLLRLSSLDADAAAAVRVIAHFQALLGGGVDSASLVRSTAGLAECAAGMELDGGRTLRYGPDGEALAGEPARVSGEVRLHPTGRVWLERPGAAGPFDDLVLEWLAIAAGVLRAGGRAVSDPALFELVLSAREAATDRTRALRLLGLVPEAPLRVMVVAGEEHDGGRTGALRLLARASVPGTVRVAEIESVGVVLLQTPDGGASPVAAVRAVARGGQRVGIGGGTAASRAWESWQQARVAVRFAAAGLPADAVVCHDELGSVALLAELPAARLRELPDIRALTRLADGEGGASAVAVLAAFCRTGSLRQAAAELHLHHSSVAARLTRVEAALGLRLRDPRDRFRAQFAVYALRLAAGG